MSVRSLYKAIIKYQKTILLRTRLYYWGNLSVECHSVGGCGEMKMIRVLTLRLLVIIFTFYSSESKASIERERGGLLVSALLFRKWSLAGDWSLPGALSRRICRWRWGQSSALRTGSPSASLTTASWTMLTSVYSGGTGHKNSVFQTFSLMRWWGKTFGFSCP